MACLRTTSTDGRFGVVSCDEKGCLFRHVALDGGAESVEDTSEADCVLQLRLRAGDSEDTVVGPDAEGNFYDATDEIKPGTIRAVSSTEFEDSEGRRYPMSSQDFSFKTVEDAGTTRDDLDRIEGQWEHLCLKDVKIVYPRWQFKCEHCGAEQPRGIMVDGLHVPEHGLYAKRGGLKWGEGKHWKRPEGPSGLPAEDQSGSERDGLEELAEGIITDYGFAAFDRVWRREQFRRQLSDTYYEAIPDNENRKKD